MKKGKLFKYLAAASGYTGIGMVLGYVLSDQVSNTPLWVGGLLVMLGAILLGMTISAYDPNGSKSSSTASIGDSDSTIPRQSSSR